MAVWRQGARPWLLAALAASSVGCTRPASSELGELPPSVGDFDDAPLKPIVVAHGGQGSPAALSDGPLRAVQAARTRMDAGDPPWEAAIVGIEGLEDDPRFNAGIGANLRMDGKTIQTDAAVMDDLGSFGAVAGIRGVRHPIRVAEAVASTPHLLMVGAGAQAFADTLKLEGATLATQRARDKLAHGWARLLSDRPMAGWEGVDWRKAWNYEVPAPKNLREARVLALGEEGADALAAAEAAAEASQAEDESADTEDGTKDTVGVVVRSSEGHYAAALSTGGTTMALRGRVGDVPQLGAGLYAGPHGAVAATGKGEAIIRERVAAEVYRRMADGLPPQQAIEVATRNITADEGVGVIAVSDLGWGAWATSQMAWAAQEGAKLYRADEMVWR